MYSNQPVEELIPYIENLKISAFRKAGIISKEVHNVTIGPNSQSPTKKQNEPVFPRSVEKTKKVSSSKIRQEVLPIRQIVNEYELERQSKVQKAIEDRAKKFELFDAQQKASRRQEWLHQQQKFVQNLQQQEKEILTALKEYDDKKINDHEKLLLYHKELEDRRQKSDAMLKAKKRERELLMECLDNQELFQSIYYDIMMDIKTNCLDERLKAPLAPVLKQCKELGELMSVLISKCKKDVSLCDEERKTLKTIVHTASELKKYVSEIISRNVSVVEETVQREAQPTATSTPNKKEESVKKNDDVSDKSVIDSSLENYVSNSNFKHYSEVMDFQENYTKLLNELLGDKNYKQFKFDCKKAVNLSVNTISAVNPQHLHDKYLKLSNLLNGRNVVIGDFQINASQHSQGIQFCTDLLAKKFVNQGDLTVSSNPEAAFSFATIIISLWNENPDFGKLLLAYFFKECPYLVPFYIPRAVDQSDEDFYNSQGYRYVDGKIEKQDKFLKRMTGIMTLYFAILISFPKKTQNKNPHNIKIAWTWFVSVLKLQPRLDITATMLYTFLETVGFQMQNTYKVQFFKLLRYFLEEYFQTMKKLDSGGPVTRLESLIQEFKENNNLFKVPNGMLTKQFW